MPKQVEVSPEDLRASAHYVDTLAETLNVQHAAADARIQAAMPSQIGRSAAMLRAAATKWQEDTAKFHARLSGHGQALRESGAMYEATDMDGARAVGKAGQQITDLDLGL